MSILTGLAFQPDFNNAMATQVVFRGALQAPVTGPGEPPANRALTPDNFHVAATTSDELLLADDEVCNGYKFLEGRT
ncbi:aldehyde dehydrogenase [Pseudomonas sp. StFLB209]|uniref:hypothetical protein n=1 Tax=Pseudomonas sp. StFLB209 TaxID=1028989 RepID=UPI0004F84C85|nr:hypothetical protein [Pseudomonas sp. StFLB209]BAP44579.1 aldehyde dehydrogenase [Pseudomonas sp. StFLB209]